MLNCFVTTATTKAVAIVPLYKDSFSQWLAEQPPRLKQLLTTYAFTPATDKFFLVTDAAGGLEKVLVILQSPDDFWAFGNLPLALPKGCYYIEAPEFSATQLEHAAIGWGLGSYQFTHYKAAKGSPAQLLCDTKYQIARIENIVTAISWARDLINLPAADIYPERLAHIAETLAQDFNGTCKVVQGSELQREFPAVYAVGRGSERQPMLLDLQYGPASAPKVALVGKGVCFDSGGLQLKPSAAMLLMKKDMAGAAHVLGLARMIMAAQLPLNLRVIIPAVENLVSGGAIKPGDVITTRKGTTIEITNTDAEGRLILADALTLASAWQPEFIFDFATLTGAARVALGPEIAALFTPCDKLAQELMHVTTKEQEPLWRLPLYQPYLAMLNSNIADWQNATTAPGGTAGAITAALFLQQFVAPEIKWAHFDVNGYNDEAKPGHPKGGEVECLRGLFNYLANYSAAQ